jgi:hypothetical protein
MVQPGRQAFVSEVIAHASFGAATPEGALQLPGSYVVVPESQGLLPASLSIRARSAFSSTVTGLGGSFGCQAGQRISRQDGWSRELSCTGRRREADREVQRQN